MVLSLSVPGFSRSNTTSPPLRSRDGNNSATLAEALRGNPFGTLQSRSRSPLITPLEEQSQEQEELNQALEALVQIFPDVKIEVFRELLVRFDGNSRLHVCVEQLLRHKDKWVAGRWNVPAGGGVNEGGDAAISSGHARAGEGSTVPTNELFRTDQYKAAVKAVLTKEFSALSRSAVDAVLAEVNFCYLRARPILQDLSRKTWRATFNNILFKRRKDKDDHPLIAWDRHTDGSLTPCLKETGCEELDRELHEALLAPSLRGLRKEREERDLKLAEELNEREAEEAGAMYECQCCFTDVTFEQISICSDHMHVICYSCIRHTIHQALFGQGWNTSVDIERSTLKCLAPSTHESCRGSLDAQIVRRAILFDKAGTETYSKFEARVASDALLKSQFKLIRCPFCSYAEVDPVYHPSGKGITWRFRRDGLISTLLMTIIFLDFIPFLMLIMAIFYFLDPTTLPSILNHSLQNMCLKVRMKRFTCANLSCQQVSCITCQKLWRDPHVCHEPLLLDLRATVEAARTAAVKRTCPRCGLSFVKSSGCNKLTCTCGYSMCYLCRKALGPPLKGPGDRGRPRRQADGPNLENINPIGRLGFGLGMGEYEDEEDEEEEHEGYRHFCEHFRVNPGSRCTACNKCELYQDEDEEAVARRAGEKAECEWRMRHQMTATGIGGAMSVNHDLSRTRGRRQSGRLSFHTQGKSWSYWFDEMWQSGQWRMEGQVLVDWVVERVIVIEDI